MERRDLLRSGAIVTAVAIAGCSGGDDEGNGNGNGDATDDEGNGNGDAADEDGETTDENETGLDDETGDENESGNESEDGDDAGDGNETDDAGGENGANESGDNESEGEDNESNADDGASNDEADDAEGGDGELFSDVIEFEESYAFETEGGEGAEGVASSGRFHDGNTYISIEESGGTVEMYTVEGETYIVEGEECMLLPGMAEEEFDEEEIENPEAEAEAQSDLRASGREEIDGEEVYVFEISGEEAEEHDEDVTYYVGVETGYVRRIETAESVTDFHSWGDVDPIEPPEMECIDLGDINESDIPF